MAFALACAGLGPADDTLTLPAPRSCPHVHGSTATGPLDVVVVIDGSRSATDPSGKDVDGDGRRGRSVSRRFRAPGGQWVSGYTSSDPGDSYLAAQVAATRSLVHASLGTGEHRLGLVLLAGALEDADPEVVKRTRSLQSSPLTDRVDHLDAALQELLRREPNGNSDFAEALQLALTTLEDGARAGTTRRVLMMTDSPKPFLTERLWRRGHDLNDYPVLIQGVALAKASEVRLDVLAIAPAAIRNPALLQWMAKETGGRFIAADASGDLDCALIEALSR